MKFIYSKKFIFTAPVLAVIAVLGVALLTPKNIYTAQQKVFGADAANLLGPPKTPEISKVPRLDSELNLSQVKAKSFLVYDAKTGYILTLKNSDQPVAIASITKLMTGLVVYENISSFKQTINISSNDIFEVEPVLNLKIDDQIEAGDLFYAMMVGSANDAALALANFVESYYNKPFVDLMNETSKRIGMKDTHFSNPLGFDSESNYSTAADLQKLVQETKKYQAFSLTGKNQNYTFSSVLGNEYSVKATNKLTKDNEDLFAIKTGFTNLAQGAMITEVKNNNNNFVIIVLDSQDREQDTLILASEIKEKYIW